MSLKKYINKLKKANAKEIQDYEKYRDEISFYRDHIQSMTNSEGNNFRHLAGSAAFAQKYGSFITNMYGLAKEFDDYFIKHKSGWDSLGDLKNNIKGSLMGVSLKSLPRHELYGKIFENYVKGKSTGYAAGIDEQFLEDKDAANIDIDGNKIYTKEDLDNMSKEELQSNHDAIMKQFSKMGIPTEAEIQASLNKKHVRTSPLNRNTADGDGHWVTIDGNHVFFAN